MFAIAVVLDLCLLCILENQHHGLVPTPPPPPPHPPPPKFGFLVCHILTCPLLSLSKCPFVGARLRHNGLGSPCSSPRARGNGARGTP